MNHFIILTKQILAGGTSKDEQNRYVGDKKNILILCCIGAVVAWGVCGFLGYKGYKIFEESMIVNIFSTFLCVFAGVMCLVSAFPMVISVFYLSSDVGVLLTLPFRTYEIIGAKLVAILYKYVFICIALVFPLLAGFGAASNAGVLYYIYAFVGTCFIPLAPVGIVGIVIVVLMRFLRFIRNKDVLVFVTMILSVVSLMVIYSFINIDFSSIDQFTKYLAGNQDKIVGISKVMLQYSFFSNSLLTGSILSFLGYIGISVLSIVVLLLVSRLFYFKGAIGMSEAGSKRKALSSKQLSKKSSGNSEVKACQKMEWRRIYREPVYLYNMIIQRLILLVTYYAMLIIASFAIISNSGNVDAADILEIMGMPETSGVLVALLCLGAIIAVTSSSVASTSLSREGHTISIMKSLPVSYAKQFEGKIRMAIWLLLCETIPFYLVVVVLFLISGASWLIIPFSLILHIGFVIMLSYIGGLIDLNSPMLKWNTEVEVARGGIHQVIPLITGILCIAIFIGIPVAIAVFLGVSAYILISVVSIAVIAATFFIRKYALTKADEIMSKIE